MAKDKKWDGVIDLDSYADFSAAGGGKIYDDDVYRFMKKHMRLLDWLNPRKVVSAALISFSVLAPDCLETEDDFKFTFKRFGK